MKKILLVLAVISVSMFSCKKEEVVKPVTVKGGGGATKDMGGWD